MQRVRSSLCGPTVVEHLRRAVDAAFAQGVAIESDYLIAGMVRELGILIDEKLAARAVGKRRLWPAIMRDLLLPRSARTGRP